MNFLSNARSLEIVAEHSFKSLYDTVAFALGMK